MRTATGEEQLRRALDGAHLPTLLMVLVQLTDERWLCDRYRPVRQRGGRDDDDAGLPERPQREIRAAALAAIAAWQRGEIEPTAPDEEQFARMVSFSIGEPVDPGQLPMLAEEVGLRDRDAAWAGRQTPGVAGPRVVIIGAGFSGLCLAIKLRRAGIPFEIVEKNATVGGTWLENVYPGCAVDSPSHLYQYSFEPYADWPDHYSRRAEILAYLERCVEKHDLHRHIRFGTELRGASWDAQARSWQLELAAPGEEPQTLRAPVLVSAVGQLNRPQIPAIAGAEDFRGPAMHTGRWDPSIEVAGRNVAVIGTGASAMQLVPALAGVAAKLTVFQRSPQWAVPNPNLRRAVAEQARWLLAHVPCYAGWYRLRQFWLWNDNIWPTLQIDPDWPHPERAVNAANDAQREFFTAHIERTLASRPDLLAKCLPRYPPYGKRMLMDVGWFETMLREDVELVTETIERITPEGVRTADGREHAADVLVYATGFQARRMLWPLHVAGRGGTTIREVWGEDDARAYLGITVPGFPNFMCMYGPNTNLGHGGSVVFHAELQARYITGLVRQMGERGIAALEVRRAVHDRYNERLDEAHRRMIWSHPGMETWYRNAAGRVVSTSPWRLVDYWRMTLRADLRDYEVTPAG